MTPHSSEPDSAAIDRLVVGDLSEPEREALIRWLEDQPVRWRACGLAFLEAQLWQQAFQPIADHSRAGVAQPAVGPVRSLQNNRRRYSVASGIVTTVTASLVAFGCGLATGRVAVAPAPEVESTAGPQAPTTPTARTASTDDQSGRDEVRATATGELPASRQQDVYAVPQPHDGVGERVVAADFALPAVPSRPTSNMPEYIERQWQRRGYEVKQTQRWLPLALNDGRRVVVPVDQWQLKYVGRPTF